MSSGQRAEPVLDADSRQRQSVARRRRHGDGSTGKKTRRELGQKQKQNERITKGLWTLKQTF
jgi:hypothetical protein